MAEKVPSKPDEARVEVMRPVAGLRQEIDRLFDDFFSWPPFHRRWMEMEPFERMAWGERGIPHHADVVERDNAFEIDIDVPGMEEKDIDVSISDHCLTVRGETHEEREEKGKEFWLSERRRGSFTRSFRIPEGVDEDQVQADLKKGVLMITLPKNAEAQKKQKKIEVRAAQ